MVWTLHIAMKYIVLFWPQFVSTIDISIFHAKTNLSKWLKWSKFLLILLITNKRSICTGEHYLPVPFTCNPLISFSLNGPLEKSSNVHYDLLSFTLKCPSPCRTHLNRVEAVCPWLSNSRSRFQIQEIFYTDFMWLTLSPLVATFVVC